MDYALEYDRMVAQSNEQQELIARLNEKLEAARHALEQDSIREAALRKELAKIEARASDSIEGES